MFDVLAVEKWRKCDEACEMSSQFSRSAQQA